MMEISLRKSAFTMVEIMVVTVIVASLAVMLLPAVSKAKEKARYGRWVGQVSTLRSDDGLVALYDFEDKDGLLLSNKAIGSDVPEYVQENMHGRIDTVCICRWTTGRWQGKGALEFGGAEPAYVEVPTTRYMNASEGAVGVWALQDKPEGTTYTGGTPHLFDCNSPGGQNAVSLLIGYDNTLAVNIGDQTWVSTGATFDDQFHFSLLTWKQGSYDVYFDGKLVQSGTYQEFDALPSYAGIGSIYGEDTYSGMPVIYGGTWVGVIDEVFIYNRQLDREDVEALYKMGVK